MKIENAVTSKTIAEESAEKFDEKLNDFLKSDITIERAYFNTSIISVQKNGLMDEPVEGIKTLFSCLIFYQDN